MFKRRTSKVRHRKAVRKLQANVMSPRIFFYDLRRALGQVVKLAFVAAALGGLGWGVWLGVREGLLENPEFRLEKVELNPNTAIDGQRLFGVAGIEAGDSVFDCDAAEIEERLEALPEVVAAKVTREFQIPGTLKVEVIPRVPTVWVACEERGVPARDLERGLLVDASGMVFPCTPALYEEAAGLPVIEVGPGGRAPASGAVIHHPDFVRGQRLLAVARARVPGATEWVDTIRQRNSWSSELTTRDEVAATFGHEDLERQMGDLLAAVEHARADGKRIATILLIGKRNLPVTFHDDDAPPRAIIVEEINKEPESDGNSDLQNLLDR